MKAFSIRLAGASLIALAAAGCTTTGVGTGQVVGQNIGATFTWTENGGNRGAMVAQLSNGEVYDPNAEPGATAEAPAEAAPAEGEEQQG